MTEVNLVTFWSGSWSLTSYDGAWTANGAYADQADECHDYTQRGVRNTFINPLIANHQTYHNYNLSLVHYPGTRNMGGLFNGVLYGNYCWDAKITMYGNMRFKHSSNEWFGSIVRQWY